MNLRNSKNKNHSIHSAPLAGFKKPISQIRFVLPGGSLIERWKFITGYEKLYIVSSKGRIKSISSRKILKAQKNPKYLFVGLRKDKKRTFHYVHRLVALAFVANPNNYPLACHKDNNPLNCNAENLYWGTYKMNTQQAIDDGLMENNEKNNFKIFSSGIRIDY